ncbi:MAG: ABC transporter permease, partial [Ginsengibacter sp.]
MAESYSFSQNAWKRLKKNKGAMIGLAIICFSILVGIFAYFISTDSTPNADRQIVEIQARKPGFKQLFIKVKKEKKISSTGFFSRLLWGSEDKSVFIPINNFRETPDSV